MQKNNPGLTLPKKIYNSPYILLTHYGYYDLAENLLFLPEIFINFWNEHVDLSDEKEINAQARELLREYSAETGDNELMDTWSKRGEMILYYIAFEDRDLGQEIEDLLSGRYGCKPGENLFSIEAYYKLIHWLPKQKPLHLKP